MAACLLPLFFSGCQSVETRDESFSSLHKRVQQVLGDNCICEPIGESITPIFKNGSFVNVSNQFFTVTPRNSSCQIVLDEREFLTQKQWDKERAELDKNLTDSRTRTNQTRVELGREFGALMRLPLFPSWHYKKTGVDVDIQCPDIALPTTEKDNAEAERYYDMIVALLKPYDKANRSQGSATQITTRSE